MRALLGVVVALAAVAALRAILGPVLAALVVGPAVCVAILCGWALLERRIFDTPPPPPPVVGPVIDVRSRPTAGRLSSQ